jgi:hypothetical protein
MRVNRNRHMNSRGQDSSIISGFDHCLGIDHSRAGNSVSFPKDAKAGRACVCMLFISYNFSLFDKCTARTLTVTGTKKVSLGSACLVSAVMLPGFPLFFDARFKYGLDRCAIMEVLDSAGRGCENRLCCARSYLLVSSTGPTICS